MVAGRNHVESRTLVFVSAHDGLGNQMFQFALGRALADRLGVPLKLDLTAFKRDPPRPYALHHFAIRAGEASPEEIRRLKPAAPWLERLGRAVRLLEGGKRYDRPTVPTCFYESLFYHFDQRVAELQAPIYVDGFWQSTRYFEQIRPALVEDFAIESPIAEGAAALLERVRGLEGVCVHVRRGDYLTDGMFHLLPHSYYEQGAALVRERVRSPVFVVFSDDPRWARENVHLPEPVIWSFEHGRRSAIEDTRLMLACKHFVIANSTFSWWPAFLSEHPEKIVILPERWFANETWDADELRVTGWVTL